MTHPGTPGSPEAPGPPPPLVGPDAGGPLAGQSVPAGERARAELEFAGFYRSHFTRLVAYLVYQGATAHLAADIAQDAMATMYRRWPEIKSPRAYAYTVAYRAFIRHALDDAAETSVSEVPEPTSVLPRPGETEAWLQQQEVTEVLRALPPRQRQVLALTIDGWAPAEIAELLSIDSATVRSSLMKARRSAGQHRRTGQEAP
jgi:RNA polymerase sigma factor (sigma-70 family)